MAFNASESSTRTIRILPRPRMLPIPELLTDGPSLTSLESTMPLFSSRRLLALGMDRLIGLMLSFVLSRAR